MKLDTSTFSSASLAIPAPVATGSGRSERPHLHGADTHDHAHHDHAHHDHAHAAPKEAHAHGSTEPHVHAPARFRPPFSLVRLSLAGRLAIALTLSAAIWAAALWAIHPIAS